MNAPAFNKAITHLPLIKILRYAIASVMVIDGVDKYFRLVADWRDYTAPQILGLLNLSVEPFLYMLGVVEILIGLIFFINARLGGLLVGGLMAGISINLLILTEHYNLILQNIIVGIAGLHIAQHSRVEKHDKKGQE